MKSAVRILKSTGILALVLTLSGALFDAAGAVVDTVYYAALSAWLPRVFPSYNFVSEKEEYYALCRALDVWAVIILVILVSLVCILFDNERREYIIGKTEGLYTIRQGIALYYPRYLRDDIIASAVAILPMIALHSLLFIEGLPNWLTRIIEMLAAPVAALMSAMDMEGIVMPLILTALVLFTVLLSLRLLFGLLGIRKWRAEWLSDTGAS